jgi:trimethylamine--corrinoid protein Co-methyltransferase
MNWMVLSDQEIEAMHLATLRILNETGISLTEPNSREIFASAGARLDEKRVYIPPSLVERCVAAASKKLTLRGRGGNTITLGDGSLHFHCSGGAPYVFDYTKKTRRPAITQDVRDMARLMDALDSYHTIIPTVCATEMPGEMMAISMFRNILSHTTKPLKAPGVNTGAEMRYIIRMAEVIGKPSEMLSAPISPVSPLILPDNEANAIIEAAKAGVAVDPLPCPIAGTSAPLSIAGALVQQNAETLVCLVLAELVKPGLPIFYHGRLSMMDPRTGLAVFGGIETGIMAAGTVQMGHYYGLPVNVFGLISNSHDLDVQNGFEVASVACLPALAGADELTGLGMCDSGLMSSLTKLVLDDEFAALVVRARRAFTADEDSIAMDVINTVANSSHNFLGHKHTLKYIRNGELKVTRFADHGPWETWLANDRKGMAEHAQAETERLLKEHEVSPLDPTQEKELDAIMAAAEKELVH